MLVDTTEFYKIEKIIQVEKNGTNIINAIEVLSNNSNQPIPSVAETTTIGRKDTIMGGTFKKGNVDVFNSQPPPLIVLADTIELYKIKKIV